MDYIEITTKIIIPILGAILIYVVVPFIKNTIIPYFESKTTATQREIMYELVFRGVAAAEQLLKDIDPTGVKRKQYVIDYMLSKDKDIDMDDLNKLIEAAVLEINIMKGKFEYTSDLTEGSQNDL